MGGAARKPIFLRIGKITKPHGVRGEVKIFPYSGQPENWKGYKRLFLDCPGSGGREEHPVDRIRIQHRIVIVQLEGVAGRAAAEALVGREVWIDLADLPQPDGDGYFLHELEGRDAVDETGMTLGRINGFLLDGGQDLMRIQGHEREMLVPVVRQFIAAIESDRVILQLPPGLLEIND